MTHHNRWIRILRPAARCRVRLFCFPYAGGGALMFRAWSRLFPDDVEVCAVVLPGREHRVDEEPVTNLRQLIGQIVAALPPLDDRPFVFFGYSLGTVVAYEVIRYLQASGQPVPQHLFVAARHAPQIVKNRVAISALPENRFVVEIAQRYRPIPDVLLRDTEQRRLTLRNLRADFTMLDAYRMEDETPLNCPLTAIGGQTDPTVSLADLDAWESRTAKEFRRHVLPGDHFFIESATAALQALVREEL